MHLSEQEKRVVQRLKNQQQAMIRWRWVALGGGLTNVGAGIYTFVLLLNSFQELDLIKAVLIAFLAPIGFGLTVLGSWLVMHVLSQWNGKAETRLLLRLIEEDHDT